MVLPGCDIAFGGILVKCVIKFLASMYEQISFVNRLQYKGKMSSGKLSFFVYIFIAPASGIGR